MNHDLPRSLIETLVRKTITEIQDEPKRSTRNLVDMALNFVDGRFQSHFFEVARTMLQNENSSYYRMIPDVAASVDTDKLVTCGLNLGYNSCTLGAKRIRELEKQGGFNIPWSITLTISGRDYSRQETAFRSVVEQGQALGIYTWMVHIPDGADTLLELAAANPDCAFVFYCEPEQITGPLLDGAESIRNLMFGVHHTEGVEDACRQLRARRLLYSVFYSYGESDVEDILSGEFLSDTETLHPIFTAFLAEPACSEATRQIVYRYVNQTRNSQQYATILWDIVNDSRFVDSVISEDSCLAGFDPEGYLYTFQSSLQKLNYNVFQQPLAAVFKQAFPKNAG